MLTNRITGRHPKSNQYHRIPKGNAANAFKLTDTHTHAHTHTHTQMPYNLEVLYSAKILAKQEGKVTVF